MKKFRQNSAIVFFLIIIYSTFPNVSYVFQMILGEISAYQKLKTKQEQKCKKKKLKSEKNLFLFFYEDPKKRVHSSE